MKRVIILLLVVFSAKVVLAEELVFFADANLKAAVEEELGVSDPNAADMLGLTYLDAGSKGIVDPNGIQYATNLTHLYLYGNQISDISALTGLTNLTTLWLHINQISDISALSGLMNLTTLYLWNNDIVDISAVSGLTKLTGLSLDGNQISDISPLSGLTNMAYLYLGTNNISDISALSSLTNLSTLRLWDNDIVDISAVSGLTKLLDLNLNHNQINDITAVSDLMKLLTLSLNDNNDINDISSVSGLTSLIHLDLYGNQISDISAITDLTNLSTLRLDLNLISDITAVSGMTNLVYLSAHNNQISDISAVSGLTGLSYLSMHRNQISVLSALSGLINLTYLALWDNQISDISPLLPLTTLQTLYLGVNPLNCLAYEEYIPLIEANNPYLSTFTYDPIPKYCDYQPDIYVSPLTYDFGEVEIGTTGTMLITISNMGNDDLTVENLAFTEDSSADFAVIPPSLVPFVVDPNGGSVDVEVLFTPLAEQCYWADLEISSDDADEPVVTVNLDGCGVITEIPPLQQIVDIVQFIRDSQADGSLVGLGEQPDKKIDVLVNMIEAVGDLINAGDLEKACQQLSIILLKCDGQIPPPDFVEGTARPVLVTMIQDLMEDLGCE